MNELVNETVLSVLAEKIRRLEEHVRNLECKNIELSQISLPNALGQLRLRQIALVLFLDHDPTEELRDALTTPERFGGVLNPHVMAQTEQHLFMLHRAPLSDEERAVFMKAFNHGQCRWY